jgi:hypothetical protein
MKKIVTLVLLLVAIGILYFNYIGKQPNVTDNSEVQGTYTTDNFVSLTLEVISTDNVKTIYSFNYKENQTLVEILNHQANNNADFTYETEKSSFGDYITSINNTKADSTKKEFWQIKVNGNDSMVGISEIKPSNNDVITFSLLSF